MAANLTALVIVLVVVVALSLLAASIRVVKQYKRGVHFVWAGSSRSANPDSG